jgi:hypothetical protein
MRSRNPIFIIHMKFSQGGFAEHTSITYPNTRAEGGITAFRFLGHHAEQN